MADTLYTPDGKQHVLLGSTTLESVIRKYAGEDAAQQVRTLLEQDAYETARAETDLGNYEESLDHWQRVAQDWIAEIDALLKHTKRRPKAELECFLENLRGRINTEC